MKDEYNPIVDGDNSNDERYRDYRVLPDESAQNGNKDTKQCEYCFAEINARASVCPYCRKLQPLNSISSGKKKNCKYCMEVMDRSASVCPRCGKGQSSKLILTVGVLFFGFCFLLLAYGKFRDKGQEPTKSTVSISSSKTAQNQNDNNIPADFTKNNSKNTVATTEIITESPTQPPTEAIEDTYEHNEYYDIVESSSYTNIIGYTIVVDKVLAKKDAEISSSIIVYDTSENVIGKGTDEITLTAGCYNYFKYTYDQNITGASFLKSYSVYNSYLTHGDNNAVELSTYNHAGTSLYLTFKQVGDISYFSKFKLLFYKNDTIVYADDGYFSTYAEGLTGAGSTDVADFWLYDVDYDRIEYIYEP